MFLLPACMDCWRAGQQPLQWSTPITLASWVQDHMTPAGTRMTPCSGRDCRMMFKTFNRRLHRHLIDITTKKQSWITPVSMKNVLQQAGFVCLQQLMGSDWALMYQQGHKKLPLHLPSHEWGGLLKSLVCLINCLQESPGFACSFEGVMYNFLAIFIGSSPTGTAELWDQMTHDEKAFNDWCIDRVKDYQNPIECQGLAMRAFQ